MKYISIDIETSGLNPEKHQILEFGAMLEDTKYNKDIDELPFFHRYILHSEITGQPYALNMNKNIIETINFGLQKVKDEHNINDDNFEFLYDDGIFCSINQLELSFIKWLKNNNIDPENYRLNIAGKNFEAFDKKFIEKIMQNIKFSVRVIDPAILYVLEDDKRLPDLQTCLNRAKINKNVEHTALEDAKDVIQLIRKSNIFK